MGLYAGYIEELWFAYSKQARSFHALLQITWLFQQLKKKIPFFIRENRY